MKADSKKYDPAIEYLHAQMLEIFHNKRQKSGGKKELCLDGIAFSEIIAEAKTRAYAKFRK